MQSQMGVTNRIIEDFLRGFKRERGYYLNQANKAKVICEEELRRSGIQAQVTARVKDRDSLRKKVHERSKMRGGYDSIQAIRDDIVDLAGVRIGLYFPNHLPLTESIIRGHFEIRQSVDHGKSKTVHGNADDIGYMAQFSGYRGKHFQVFLKADNDIGERSEDGDNSRSKDKNKEGSDAEDAEEDKDVIEIQVVSMLHHAWTEVEHDLVYKQMSGSVSTEERRILDGLSGLIQVGELLLEQLHEAHFKRSKSENKSFTNFYELGSFLAAQQVPSDTDNGPLEFLYEFLRTVGYHKPSRLDSVISRLRNAGWQKGKLNEHLGALGRAEPSLSVILIEAILTRLHEKSHQDNSLSTMEKFQATVRTFIALDTFFPPFQYWADSLLIDGASESFRGGFEKWLNVVQKMDDVLRGRRDPTEEEKIALDKYGPWAFLQNHHDLVISFAFRLAKMGGCHDLSRFIHLRKILRFALPVAVPPKRHITSPAPQQCHSERPRAADWDGVPPSPGH